jgi:hypothetical protein
MPLLPSSSGVKGTALSVDRRSRGLALPQSRTWTRRHRFSLLVCREWREGKAGAGLPEEEKHRMGE